MCPDQLGPTDDADAYVRRLLNQPEDAGWAPTGTSGCCRRCETGMLTRVNAEGLCLYCWRTQRANAANRIACDLLHRGQGEARPPTRLLVEPLTPMGTEGP